MQNSVRSSVRFKAMLALTVMFICLTLTACQSSGSASNQSAAPLDSVTSLRAQLVSARAQVSKNMLAADTLPDSGAALPKAFAAFIAETDTTRAAASSAAKRAAALRVNSSKYIATWQEQLSALNSPQQRAAGSERANFVSKKYEAVRENAAQVKNAYAPFLDNLTELEVYLQQDLTLRGVNAAKPMNARIDASGKSLIESMDDMIASLDHLLADAANVKPANNTGEVNIR